MNNYDINFDIIFITETRLRTGHKALYNIGIENYVTEHTMVLVVVQLFCISKKE